MNNLELCKKFAELEGVELYRENIRQEMLDEIIVMLKQGITKDDFCDRLESDSGFHYNPITDLALNCAARDKYEVHTDYINKSASMWIRHESNDERVAQVNVKTSADMPRAVIECILKSKGLIK